MTVKYEDIAKANEAIKTTTIERKNKDGSVVGKEYAEVNQRIKAFRMVYPGGRITTDILKMENGMVLMKSIVTDEAGNVLSTGYAQEKENASVVNRTSYIENCETSAVGRALGMCGFGIDASVASAEEVKNAIEQQIPRITEKQYKFIAGAYKENLPKLLKNRGLQKLDDMTREDADKIISDLKEIESKRKAEEMTNVIPEEMYDEMTGEIHEHN